MAMNTQSVAALLNFFPLSGVFTTLTLKMQAAPFRKPRDTLLGVFPELWYGDETERPKRWIPLGSAQFYLLLFQACEGPLPQFVSDIIYKSIHGIKRSKKEKDSKQKQLPASEEVLKHPLISIPTISYLFIRPAVYTAFSFLSHPFSIVRTYYLIKTDLPASEISYFNRTIEDGIYRRSYTSHLVSGVSEIWVGHLFLRFFSWCKDRYFPKEETPSANALRGSTKRGVITAAVRQSRMSEIRELFGQNVVRTLSLFATRTVLFPLFTIRARLEGEWTHNEVRHEGFLDCCSHILQEEGVSGFYRGFPAHIVSFGMQSVYIGLLYAMARGFIQADLWEDEEPENEQNSRPTDTALPKGKQI